MARYTEELFLQDGKATTYITDGRFEDDGSIIFAATLLSGDVDRALTVEEKLEILDFTIEKLTEWRADFRKEVLIKGLAGLK